MDPKFPLFKKAAQTRGCKSEEAFEIIRESLKDLESTERKSILFRIPRLRRTIKNNNLVYKVLRCRCEVCSDKTTYTPLGEDESLSIEVINDDNMLQMFTALCLIACTFMLRSLNTLQLRTIEAVLRKLAGSGPADEPQPELGDVVGPFKPIADNYKIACHHDPRHGDTLEDMQRCLLYHFRDSLNSIKWLFETPKFTNSSNPMQLEDEVNLPFLGEIEIKCAASKEHRFFYFKIEPHSWQPEDRQLIQNGPLFRKEIRMPPTKKDPPERAVLRYISQIQDRNIARLLFSYVHFRGNNTYSNLVFNYHPLDLHKIFNPPYYLSDNPTIHSLERNALERFLSTLTPALPLRENPLWQGMLDIVKAVYHIHNLPPPENDASKNYFIGGHFDIKPANILVDDDAKTLILTDFGQSRLKRLSHDETTDITATPGTIDYQPPRSSNGNIKLNRAYDIWSLACVLTEALVFIFSRSRQADGLEVRDDVVAFRNERRQESLHDSVASSNFWMYEGPDRKVVLKPSVLRRLKGLEISNQDAYLTKCIETIREIFSRAIERSDQPAMKAEKVLELLSDVPGIDSSILVSSDAYLVGGPGTKLSLERIKVDVLLERGRFPCKLSLWFNSKTDEYHLISEIKTGNKTFVLSENFKNSWEHIIPLSLYDMPSSDHKQNRIGFRYSHHGREFHFYEQLDMDRFFGATTKYFPRETFSSVSCEWVSRLRLKKKTFNSPGSIHILQELSTSRYKELYIDHSSSSSKGKDKMIKFWLVFYYSDGSNHCMITDLSFVAMSSNDEPSNQVIITHKEDRSFNIGFLATPKPQSGYMDTAYRESYFNDYPGFSIRPKGVQGEIVNGMEVHRLSLRFGNVIEKERFQEAFGKLYKKDQM